MRDRARPLAGPRFAGQLEGRRAVIVTIRAAHVSTYVDPTIARQLRIIAAAEDSSVQQLVEEGIALVLQSRGK